MFRSNTKVTLLGSALSTLELIFHAGVRSVRKQHGNAVLGLLMNIVQSVVMIGVMLVMFELLGMRSSAVRGDFVLYLMSGVFNFTYHTKALGAVSKSEASTSTMMRHTPMNSLVAVGAAALGALYLQTLSVVVILLFYHVIWTPITIYDPVGMSEMFLLSWAAGIAIGLIFKAVMPWQPEFLGIATSLYSRANMIFSGKMMLANKTPEHTLVMYTWNPLFHTIDQSRGDIFENYHPHHSNVSYPLMVTAVLIVIGFMADNFTKKHASVSWGAKR
jgi:ABC-type polysaccharide/polyol phosphate export permease